MLRKLLVTSVSLVLLGFNVSAHATTLNFIFTGECDDCAFNGDPIDPNFDPLNDGLTQTVTANLRVYGADIVGDEIVGFDDLLFEYQGSNLINPFSFDQPFLFGGFDVNGNVMGDEPFILSSSSNPDDPFGVGFPNFCTPTGRAVLGASFDSACDDVGMVEFMLDSDENFSISGNFAFDIGSGGSLTAVSPVPLPAAFWFFGTGLVGLIGVARRKA